MHIKILQYHKYTYTKIVMVWVEYGLWYLYRKQKEIEIMESIYYILRIVYNNIIHRLYNTSHDSHVYVSM